MNYVVKRESAFTPAIDNRTWHAELTSPRPEPFSEIELLVRARGENTSRFFPYAIKTVVQPDGRHFSFNFRDGGEVPFDGAGTEIRLFCTLTYAVDK